MSQAFSALWASIVRTIVPIIVGAVLGFFTSANIQVDPEFEKLLTAALTLVFTTLYYVAVRLFETYISPKLGWLLGYAKSPGSYSSNSPRETSMVSGEESLTNIPTKIFFDGRSGEVGNEDSPPQAKAYGWKPLFTSNSGVTFWEIWVEAEIGKDVVERLTQEPIAEETFEGAVRKFIELHPEEAKNFDFGVLISYKDRTIWSEYDLAR